MSLFGPILVTLLCFIFIYLIIIYEVQGLSSIFTIMIIDISLVSILLDIYSFFVLFCGSKKRLFDISVLLIFFCLLMASFPTVFWIMRQEFGDMVEKTWNYTKNANLREKYEEAYNCQSDCHTSFREFIDSFSNKIAFLLLFFVILILVFDVIFLLWNSHQRKKPELSNLIPNVINI